MRMPPESCAGKTLDRFRQTHMREFGTRGSITFLAVHPLQFEGKRDVIQNGSPRQQVRVLEHDCRARLGGPP